MPNPGGRLSDSHIRLDPAIRPELTRNATVETGVDASLRVLNALDDLQARQSVMPRGPALALERAAFAEVFNHPEPGLRIRRFLDKGLE
jgi:hypothetical protein